MPTSISRGSAKDTHHIRKRHTCRITGNNSQQSTQQNYGVSLGVTFVFFAGILAGHFGLSVDPQMLNYAESFGLVPQKCTLPSPSPIAEISESTTTACKAECSRNRLYNH